MQFETIPKGTWLYRGARTTEELPTPRKCEDSLKVGVYFSAFNPYLSETMCTEYDEDLFVSIYEVTEDIQNVSVGKYAFTKEYSGRYAHGWDSVPEEDNISHIDYDVGPIDTNVVDCKDKFAELFLIEKDLSKIKFVTSYLMTVEHCKEKWY